MPTPLPARGERTAPKFDPDFEEQLPTFFEEFEGAATAADIADDDAKMKKECLRYVDAATMRFWRSLETYKGEDKTWKEFKEEVLQNYPDALQTAEVTVEELLKVIAEHQKSGVSTSKGLARYHRAFSTVATALMNQGILSGVQVVKHYVAVFPAQIRSRLDTRLQVQFPKKKKGEAYTLHELKEAVDYLLSDASTTTSFSSGSSFEAPAPVIAPKSEPQEPSVAQQLATLTEAVAKLVSGGGNNGNRRRTQGTSDIKCRWDGVVGHMAKDCEDLTDWVAKGRVEMDERGFIRLKGGKSLPRGERYQNGDLKDRFKRYFEDNPSEKTWMLDVVNSPAFTIESTSYAGVDCNTHSSYTLRGLQGPSMTMGAEDSDEDVELKKIKELLYKMETRKATKEKTEKSKSATDSTTEEPSKKSNPAPANLEPSQPVSGRIQHPAKLPKPVIGKLPENYQPPKERTVGAVPKEDSRNYRYKAPIETDAALERVLRAGLSSMVTITQEDLLAILADYRRKIKESVTSKRVGLNSEPPNNSLIVDNPVETYLPGNPSFDPIKAFMGDFGDSQVGDKFYVAEDSQSIRAVNATIGHQVVHSILDSGCSIVAMSDAACNALHLMFDDSFRIPIQSANGETDWTLGLARNVPFRFGDVTAFCQVHIVPSPAYEVLLGRPFDILTQSVVRNFLSGDQHISLHDPNSHKNVTIPTLPRELPYFRKAGY